MAQSGLEQYIPRQHRAAIKRQLREQWGFECAYCGFKEHNKELTLDHVVPVYQGGTDAYNNLVPSCRKCNLSKGNRPMAQWYFDHEDFTTERWFKIKQHITTKEQHDLSSM